MMSLFIAAAMDESYRLTLKNNSVRNNVIECHSLGLSYLVEKNARVLTLSKWDKHTHANCIVGEIDYHFLSKDMMRMGGDEKAHWMPVNDFIRRASCLPLSSSRIWIAKNGQRYIWKERWGTLYLYRDGGRQSLPVAEYHHAMFRPGQSYLRILDKELLDSSDELILSFLIVEKRRRDRRKRQRAAGGGPGDGGGGGGE